MLTNSEKLILRECREGLCDLYLAWCGINTAYPDKSKEEIQLIALEAIRKLLSKKYIDLFYCVSFYKHCEKINNVKRREALLNEIRFWEPKSLGDEGVYLEASAKGEDLFKKIANDKVLKSSWI